MLLGSGRPAPARLREGDRQHNNRKSNPPIDLHLSILGLPVNFGIARPSYQVKPSPLSRTRRNGARFTIPAYYPQEKLP